MNFPTPETITAYAAAIGSLAITLTTLIVAIRNAVKTDAIHAMVKADASPEAVASVKPATPADGVGAK